MRQFLGGQHVELSVPVLPGEHRRQLAAAVDHQHRAVRIRRGQHGGRRVGDMVADEPDRVGVEAGQRAAEELRRPLGVKRAQVLPVAVESGDIAGLLGHQPGVVGIADGVDVGRRQSGVFQAPLRGGDGQFPS